MQDSCIESLDEYVQGKKTLLNLDRNDKTIVQNS